MQKISLITIVLSLLLAGPSIAMQDMDHGDAKQKDDHGSAMHDMDHGSESKDGTFTHTEMAGDIHAEFQVMELASMNMKDPEGNTHHVMATFTRNGEKIEKIAGKVKIISPSGKEQLASLEAFGSGIFAANFTIDEPGKWGVICLFKDADDQQTLKFWYPHMMM